jgi:hypothetical protein
MCINGKHIRVIVSAGWLEMANDAFYLIGSAVFQCMEYH